MQRVPPDSAGPSISSFLGNRKKNIRLQSDLIFRTIYSSRRVQRGYKEIRVESACAGFTFLNEQPFWGVIQQIVPTTVMRVLCYCSFHCLTLDYSIDRGLLSLLPQKCLTCEVPVLSLKLIWATPCMGLTVLMVLNSKESMQWQLSRWLQMTWNMKGRERVTWSALYDLFLQSFPTASSQGPFQI